MTITIALVAIIFMLVIILAHAIKSTPQAEAPGRFNISVGQPKKKGENQMLNITIQNDQKIEVKLTPVTASGQPATLDGKPSWNITGGDSTIEVSEDGLSAFLISSDTPGQTVVVVEADADLGEGVVTLSDSIELTVEGAKAVNLGLSVGTAVPK